jgi:GNAT superfamily N-acetyltransferase
MAHNSDVPELTFCALTPADTPAITRLLERDRVANVYLRSELRIGPPVSGWWGIADDDGELRAVVLATGLAVPAMTDVADAPALADAMFRSGILPRMLVGPRVAALALHEALSRLIPARSIRDPQPLLTLTRDAARDAESIVAVDVRRATRDDLDALAQAATAMHSEEIGDGLGIEPESWRQRMTVLMDRGWSWVGTVDDEIVFKTELSAWTPECVQLQGVYTLPAWRGRGVASVGLAAVCRELLYDVATCCLYVNDYNASARRLYERIGFTHHCDFATVLY